jgi:hypothetical protein
MKSRDRTLNRPRLTADLLNTFLPAGGSCGTGARVEGGVERGRVHSRGTSDRCRYVIAASACQRSARDRDVSHVLAG